MKKAGIIARGRIDCFIDRAQGQAALEDAVMDARVAVRAALNALDPDLPLVSPQARRIGQTWFDLLMHTLGRGVKLSLTLNDPGGVSDDVARLLARIDAEPHTGRRCGDLTLQALQHPALRSRGHPGYRMNIVTVDDRLMFVARRGLVPGPGRDLSMVAHGPMVAEGTSFLDSYVGISAGTDEPAPARRLLRTLSHSGRGLGRFFTPHTVANEVESAHHMLIRRAERLIYIETQDFDCPALAEHLARRAEMSPQLNLILIVPRPLEGRGPAHALRLLSRSFGSRFLLGHAPGGCTNVSVFDDQMAIAGSADLDARGLRSDVGVSLYLRASDGVAALRRRLSQHWIPDISAESGAQEWRQALTGVNAPELLIA